RCITQAWTRPSLPGRAIRARACSRFFPSLGSSLLMSRWSAIRSLISRCFVLPAAPLLRETFLVAEKRSFSDARSQRHHINLDYWRLLAELLIQEAGLAAGAMLSSPVGGTIAGSFRLCCKPRIRNHSPCCFGIA